MKLKRYSLRYLHGHSSEPEMLEEPKGKWVPFNDVSEQLEQAELHRDQARESSHRLFREVERLTGEMAALKKERDLYRSVVEAAIRRVMSMPPVYSGPLFEMLQAMREAVK